LWSLWEMYFFIRSYFHYLLYFKITSFPYRRTFRINIMLKYQNLLFSNSLFQQFLFSFDGFNLIHIISAQPI